MTTEPIRNHSSSEAPPQTAEVAADLDFPLTGLHLSTLTQGPAVMIGRPPPPAAPKSGPPCDRLCHSKVAGQDTACRVVERASSTLRHPKTQDKCQSLRTKGALERRPHAGPPGQAAGAPGSIGNWRGGRGRGSSRP